MKSLLAFLFVITFVAATANAQWQQTSGPEGGEVHAIVAQGNVLFATTAAGIFKSTDNGVSWFSASNGLPAGPPTSIVSDGTMIYVEIGGYLFTSTDEGSS